MRAAACPSDRTTQRSTTFFEGGFVAHVPFADPYCGELRKVLIRAAKEVGATVHEAGTLVNMEGPAFSTKAESHLHRAWGAHVIGMTNMSEARLAREAEISFATVALSTDYDCWHDTHESVTVTNVRARVCGSSA